MRGSIGMEEIVCEKIIYDHDRVDNHYGVSRYTD